jgi:hypothetical protein
MVAFGAAGDQNTYQSMILSAVCYAAGTPVFSGTGTTTYQKLDPQSIDFQGYLEQYH